MENKLLAFKTAWTQSTLHPSAGRDIQVSWYDNQQHNLHKHMCIIHLSDFQCELTMLHNINGRPWPAQIPNTLHTHMTTTFM